MKYQLWNYYNGILPERIGLLRQKSNYQGRRDLESEDNEQDFCIEQLVIFEQAEGVEQLTVKADDKSWYQE